MGVYGNGGVYLMDQGGLSYGDVRSFQRAAIGGMARALVHQLTKGEAVVSLVEHDTKVGHYTVLIQIEPEPGADFLTVERVPLVCDVHLGLAHDAIMSATKKAMAEGQVPVRR